VTAVLKTDATSTLIGDDRTAQDSPRELFNATSLIRLLRCRARLIATVAIVFLTVTTVVTFALTPRYTAEAIITLDERKNSVTDADAVLSSLTGDAATVQNQIQILQSRSLLARVIDKVHLQDEPALNPALEYTPQFAALHDNATFKWLTAQWDFWFRSPVYNRAPEEAAQDKNNEIIDRLLRGLTVSTAGFSPAIEIKFTSTNPQQAARVANAIVDAYMEDQLNAKLEATKHATKFLSDRLNELGAQVKSADAAVTQFRAGNDLLDQGSGISSVDQQLTTLNSQLVLAQLELTDQTAKAARIRGLQTTRNADLTPVVDSPLIAQLRTEESTLQRQEAELSTKYGPRHPKMIDLQSQKASLQRKIQEEVGRVGRATSNDVATRQIAAGRRRRWSAPT
jgi:uncharacterized protein involved in exopolysaccharide biosynthesis